MLISKWESFQGVLNLEENMQFKFTFEADRKKERQQKIDSQSTDSTAENLEEQETLSMLSNLNRSIIKSVLRSSLG